MARNALEKSAPDMKHALELCLEDMRRTDRRHTDAYKIGQLALSRANGMLTDMEDEEVYGAWV